MTLGESQGVRAYSFLFLWFANGEMNYEMAGKVMQLHGSLQLRDFFLLGLKGSSVCYQIMDE
jgi:hypothetical protein